MRSAAVLAIVLLGCDADSAVLDAATAGARDASSAPDSGPPALDATKIPRRPGCDLRAALTDGEDYELLFALRRSADRDRFAVRWRQSFPRTPLSCIGQFAAPANVPVDAIPLRNFQGYEHLR